MGSKNILIKVNQLYKIFGDGDKSVLDLVKNGMEVIVLELLFLVQIS